MAKDSVGDWDIIADNNTDIGGVGTDGNVANTADVPFMIRNIMAQIAVEKADNYGITSSPWTAKGISELYTVDTSLTGAEIPPTDSSDFRYVLLTAGEDGVGEYNEGIVTNESLIGSAPEITATCDIDLSGSPMDGQTIHLWNTEGRFLRASITPGELLDSANKNHFHTGSATAAGGHTTLTRASSVGGGGGNYIGSTQLNVAYGNVSSLATPAHTHTLSINNQGGDEARPRSAGMAVYMRIN